MGGFKNKGVKMVTGTVKWFNRTKGFGFIEVEGQNDVFVHISEVEKAGLNGLNEGDQVDFDIQETDRGGQAVNLKKA